MMYEWIVDTEIGKKNSLFHLGSLKYPMVFNNDFLGFKVYVDNDFYHYREGIHYTENHDVVFDRKNNLQLGFNFD